MPHRISSVRTRRAFYALLVASVIASFLALGVVLIDRFDTSARACEQVNVLRIAITRSLRQSEKALPRIAYYRHHPKDLALAERQIAGELAQFHPVRC